MVRAMAVACSSAGGATAEAVIVVGGAVRRSGVVAEPGEGPQRGSMINSPAVASISVTTMTSVARGKARRRTVSAALGGGAGWKLAGLMRRGTTGTLITRSNRGLSRP